MNKTKLIVNLASVLVVATAAIIGYRIWKGQSPRDESDVFYPPETSETAPPDPAGNAPAATPAAPQHPVPETTGDLAKLIRQWEKNHGGESGTARNESLRALSKEVIAKLGPGEALFSYAGYLASGGNMEEHAWLVDEGFRELFSGPHGEAARKWMLDRPDNTMSRRFWLAAGRTVDPQGFKEYLAGLSNSMIQDRVLTGYCMNLAVSDGNKVIQAWATLKPAAVSFYGLVEIFRMLSENSDFATINGQFPGDSNELARLIRKSLFQRWADIHPDDAADLVLSGGDQTHPGQMGVVIGRWATKDPDAAATWLEEAPECPATDEGLAVMARHLAERSPAKAWTFVTAIANPEIRRRSADRVAMEWRRTDPKAADLAIGKLQSGS